MQTSQGQTQPFNPTHPFQLPSVHSVHVTGVSKSKPGPSCWWHDLDQQTTLQSVRGPADGPTLGDITANLSSGEWFYFPSPDFVEGWLVLAREVLWCLRSGKRPSRTTPQSGSTSSAIIDFSQSLSNKFHFTTVEQPHQCALMMCFLFFSSQQHDFNCGVYQPNTTPLKEHHRSHNKHQ